MTVINKKMLVKCVVPVLLLLTLLLFVAYSLPDNKVGAATDPVGLTIAEGFDGGYDFIVEVTDLTTPSVKQIHAVSDITQTTSLYNFVVEHNYTIRVLLPNFASSTIRIGINGSPADATDFNTDNIAFTYGTNMSIVITANIYRAETWFNEDFVY